MAGAVAAFAVYTLFRPANQLALQGPVAVLLSTIFFVSWYLVTLRLPRRWLQIGDTRNLVLLYVAALVWNPVLFVPAHYLVRGYVTPFVNIRNGWVFQACANLVVLGTVYLIARARGSQPNHHKVPRHGAAPVGRGS